MSEDTRQPTLQELFPDLHPALEQQWRERLSRLFAQITRCKDAYTADAPPVQPQPVVQLRLYPEDKRGSTRGVQLELSARLEIAQRTGARQRLEKADAERFADDFFGSL